jgi:hypothetical protein
MNGSLSVVVEVCGLGHPFAGFFESLQNVGDAAIDVIN